VGDVPYYTEDDADFNKPNNLGVDSVPKLILRDLDEAVTLLPDDPRNNQAGRATKWKALAYKGRVQMLYRRLRRRIDDAAERAGQQRRTVRPRSELRSRLDGL